MFKLRIWQIFLPVCDSSVCCFLQHIPDSPVNYTERSNETPTWCNTVQVLFLQGHSTCFGRKHPSSGVFKTSTAATGTCVIVVGQSSHLLIRRLRPKHVEWPCRNKTCTVLHQVGVSFDLYYDARKHKLKNYTERVAYVYNVLCVCVLHTHTHTHTQDAVKCLQSSSSHKFCFHKNH